MSDTLGSLMERNLLEVFGQRDSARRAAAIAELYTADCTFFEAEERLEFRGFNAQATPGAGLQDAEVVLRIRKALTHDFAIESGCFEFPNAAEVAV